MYACVCEASDEVRACVLGECMRMYVYWVSVCVCMSVCVLGECMRMIMRASDGASVCV